MHPAGATAGSRTLDRMVHNINMVSDRVSDLILALEEERLSDPSGRSAISMLDTAAEVTSEAKALLPALVENARSAGATWADIAHALGHKDGISAPGDINPQQPVDDGEVMPPATGAGANRCHGGLPAGHYGCA